MPYVDAPFYVKNTSKELVPAKFLVGIDGEYIVNPHGEDINKINSLDNHYYNSDGKEIENANPNNYLVVPINYSLSVAKQFSDFVNDADIPSAVMIGGFIGKGSQNLQRSYEEINGNIQADQSHVPMFQDAASYHLGITSQLSGYGSFSPEIGGDILAEWTHSSFDPHHSHFDPHYHIKIGMNKEEWKNTDRNNASIEAGVAYVKAHQQLFDKLNSKTSINDTNPHHEEPQNEKVQLLSFNPADITKMDLTQAGKTLVALAPEQRQAVFDHLLDCYQSSDNLIEKKQYVRLLSVTQDVIEQGANYKVLENNVVAPSQEQGYSR